MALHRETRPSGEAAPRRLLLVGRDKLLLTVCIIGLLVAWLVFAASGGGGGRDGGTAPIAGTTTTATAAPRTPATREVRPSTAPPVGPAAAAPQHISYPAAKMDVVVRPLQPDTQEVASQSIVPPETMDGYWLTPFGVPGAGSTNTTYVVGHSWESSDAPFNRLSTMATPGDELTVQTETGAIAYKVDSVTTYVKSTLKDSPIWTVVPNRLVLISCYTGDLWGKNVVVVASPVASS
jgi:hypothetical protein